MTSSIWRATVAAGMALAASGVLGAGCSKGGDSADYGGADPGAVTRATDSAEAGATGPSAAASGAPVGGSGVVSSARTVPSESAGVGPSPALSAGPTTPSPSVSPDQSASSPGAPTTGRATGPRS